MNEDETRAYAELLVALLLIGEPSADVQAEIALADGILTGDADALYAIERMLDNERGEEVNDHVTD